ncbi:hypothetical protein [Deinococcus multiflagellatus]|uniref:LPS export ABC transporter periplasmic protein LptC n=1 Tax=Deinococcus multiflagellatus TaxID=1656887 RepID=A0ABW1ZJE2_9DEIO
MQKTGLYALAGITLFALVFAFVPTGRRDAGTGVTLSGVELRLYPSRDPDAVWSFRAAKVDSDPLQNRTRLTGLSGGQRVVKEKDARGRYTGRMTLDARLTTPDLTIDGQDNMTTRQARITLVKECADIDLTGNEQTLVRIEGAGAFMRRWPRCALPSSTATTRSYRWALISTLKTWTTTTLSLIPTSTPPSAASTASA